MQRHDHLFRVVFSQPRHAEGLLRSSLPAELSSRIDWRSLRVLPSTFVDNKLEESRADLLFSVVLDRQLAFLHLLVEHQSTPDSFMPLRLLGYMVRIWNEYRRDHPRAKRLPPIVPIVCHHSKRG